MPAPRLTSTVRSMGAMAGARLASEHPEWRDTPRLPTSTFGDKALDYASELGMGVVRPVLSGLELLARPWGAVVEAYGAAEEDMDPWRAAKRVLSKGTEKRQFPTIGERLIPEEEDEDLGRMFARLGVEIATDPTTWLGPGAVKGIGGALVKGGKYVGKTKAVQKAIQSKAAQTASEFLIPTMENMSVYGGRGGKLFGAKHLRGSRAKDALDNKETGALIDKVKELGLSGNKHEADRIAAAQALRSGRWEEGIRTGDARIDGLTEYLSDRLNVYGRLVRSFRDPTGKGVEITHKLTKKNIADIEGYAKANKIKFREAFGAVMGPEARFMSKKKGYTTPFQLEESYYPQVLNEEQLLKAMTKSGFEEQTQVLMKQLNTTEAQARKILKEQTGRVKKAGHIEHARTVKDIPDEFLELDPLKVMPRYTKQTFHRLAMASEFDLDGKKGLDLLKSATKEGLSTRTADEAMRQVQGVFTESASGIDAIAPALLGWNVLSKMGVTSGLAQVTQASNSIVAHGLGNWLKGLYKIRTTPGMGKRAIESYNGALRNQARFMAGGDSGSKVSRAATTYLRGTGFMKADMFARSSSYAGGVAMAEGAARKAIKKGVAITDELKEMGFTRGDVRYFKNTGKLSPGTERRIGSLAAEKTQFLSRFTDLPPMFQKPEMRVAMQFKSFIYQQSRFLAKEVMMPAVKYLDTGGKQGSIGPLLRALGTFPAAGNTVAATRELMSEMSASAIGARRKRRRKIDENHPIWQMVQDSMYVGAFGMGADVLQQASRGNFLEYILGPTVSDISGGFEFVGQKAFARELPTAEELANALYPHLWGRRVLPLQPQEVVGAAERGIRKVKRAIR